MPLPRSVLFKKIRFLKGLEDMSLNFLHKDREAIRTPMVHVQKQLQHYVTNIFDVISGYIAEQCISADCDPIFSSLEK